MKTWAGGPNHAPGRGYSRRAFRTACNLRLRPLLDLAIWSSYFWDVEVNVHEAKSQLSRLIERAIAGEEVIIAKAGRPVVRLVRIDRDRPELGTARGTFVFAGRLGRAAERPGGRRTLWPVTEWTDDSAPRHTCVSFRDRGTGAADPRCPPDISWSGSGQRWPWWVDPTDSSLKPLQIVA